MISSDKVAQKLAAKPNYELCTIFDENLIAVHTKKTKLYFNKPVYLGMSILDLSKFITTILRLNMGIRQTYFSTTPTLSLMKLQPKIFTKIKTQTLRNGLTQVTTRLITHLDLKQNLIVKC